MDPTDTRWPWALKPKALGPCQYAMMMLNVYGSGKVLQIVMLNHDADTADWGDTLLLFR